MAKKRRGNRRAGIRAPRGGAVGSLVLTRSEDISYVNRLRDLLGRKVSSLRAGQHPLAEGLEALARKDRRAGLIGRQRPALAGIIQDAKLIFRHAEGWRDYAHHFVADLLDAKLCSAILFELYVMAFALEGKLVRLSGNATCPTGPTSGPMNPTSWSSAS
jgi:hypothetical protein